MKLFADRLRGLQVLPVTTDFDRGVLKTMPDTFTGRFAATFAVEEQAFEQKRIGMRGLHGLDQDMNRIARRYSQAMFRIRDANGRMHTFFNGEFVAIVAAKLTDCTGSDAGA